MNTTRDGSKSTGSGGQATANHGSLEAKVREAENEGSEERPPLASIEQIVVELGQRAAYASHLHLHVRSFASTVRCRALPIVLHLRISER
jgi:hypothetical protein